MLMARQRHRLFSCRNDCALTVWGRNPMPIAAVVVVLLGWVLFCYLVSGGPR